MKDVICCIFLAILLFSCKKDKQTKKASWEPVLTNTDEFVIFRDVEFLNENTGYILAPKLRSPAGNQALWYTTDGGRTWKANEFYFKDEFIINIHAANNRIYGTGQHVYYSENNGISWTNISSSLPLVGIANPYFINTDSGFITSCNKIMQTKDHGETWKEVFGFEFMSCIRRMLFTTNKTVYAAGGSFHDNTNFGFIIKSEDGGETWKMLNTNFANIGACYFLNDRTGYIFTMKDSGVLYKTSDGGSTWKLINNNMGEYNPKVFFLSENEGYYGGRAGIFHTTDGGITWEKEYTVASGDVVTDITFKGRTGIAITSKGLALRIQR